MVEPGLLVHAEPDLEKQRQVLRAQVELLARPAEVEAALGRQLTLDQAAAMLLALGFARLRREPERRLVAVAHPGERLAGAQGKVPELGNRDAERAAEPGQRFLRPCTDRNQRIGRFERRTAHALGMDA